MVPRDGHRSHVPLVFRGHDFHGRILSVLPREAAQLRLIEPVRDEQQPTGAVHVRHAFGHVRGRREPRRGQRRVERRRQHRRKRKLN